MGGSSGALYQIFFLALAGMQLSSPECQYLAVLSKASQAISDMLRVCDDGTDGHLLCSQLRRGSKAVKALCEQLWSVASFLQLI